MDEKALKVRKEKKGTKPSFIVKEAKFTAGVKRRWRYPRGKHSAVRQRHKGRPALPQPGYGSPKAVRGFHPQGWKEVLVHNQTELLGVNSADEGAIIATGVGDRKKLELLQLALEKKILLLNVKDIQGSIDQIKGNVAEKKKVKQEKIKEKDQKQEEKQKKAEEKKKKEEKQKEKQNKEEDSTSEEKKEKEDKIETEEDKQKKIIEKTITKRQ